MQLILSAVLGLASFALAQNPDGPVCPTATRTTQNRDCHKTCAYSDCTLQTTIINPCGCPPLATATLIAPCEADCPYQGCSIDFRTLPLPCPTIPTTTTTSSPWHWHPTTSTPTSRRTTTTSSSSTPTGVITSIVTLPRPTHSTTPCPTVTHTTSPGDCSPLRCPVPTCQVRSTLAVPCGCTPKTVLYVTGCATECPDGCLTRTETVSAATCTTTTTWY